MIRVAVEAASAIERAGVEALLAGDAEIVISDADPDLVIVVGPAEIPPGAPAVVIGAEDARDALRHGARAVLPRGATAAELAAAVRAAAAGLVSFDAATAESLLAPAPVSATADQNLTPRELDVLRRMADGLANKNIAYELGISEHTVKFHVASILAKLGAGSRTEAVAIGLRRGYVLL